MFAIDAYGNILVSYNESYYNDNNDTSTIIDGIVKLDKNLKLLWQHQQEQGSDTDASYNAIQPTSDGGYLILSAQRFHTYNMTGQVLIKINAQGKRLWSKQLASSGRYGTLIKTPEQTFLVASESLHGRAYLAEINKKGKLVFQYIYSQENTWSPANYALKLPDGYILALQAHTKKDEDQIRSAVLVYLKIKKS